MAFADSGTLNTLSRVTLLRSKFKSLLLCGCLSISQFLMLKVTVYLQRPANAALLVQLQSRHFSPYHPV